MAIATSRPRAERIAAFRRRQLWLRTLIADGAPAPVVMERMVAQFGTLGILEARPGVENDPDLPPVMWVESLPTQHIAEQAQKAVVLLAAAPTATEREQKLAAAGWASEEQLAEFRNIRVRNRR